LCNSDFSLQIQPRISPQGDLTFLPAPLKTGSTQIEVQLFDSGGTDGGCVDGSDRSALKRFKVNLVAAELLPQLQALDIIHVYENEERGGGLTVFNYFGNSLVAPTIPAEVGNGKLISDVAFEMHCYSPQHFEGAMGVPRMDDLGTLTFASAYGFYGDSTVSFRLVSTSGRTTPWSNFTIRVHPINHPPAFKLPLSDVITLEDHPWLQHRFALNISKGLFPEASEIGIYYSDSPYSSNEEHQQLTFKMEIVDGNTQLFDTLSMSANGTFAFKLALHENGHARMMIRLNPHLSPLL
jgi:hypothetical protein